MTSFTTGWYPDPADPRVSRFWTGAQWAGERFWDGSGWVDRAPLGPTPWPASGTSGYQPGGGTPGAVNQWGGVVGPTPRPALSPRIRNRVFATLIGAACIVIGALLPWASQNNGFATSTIDGTSAGGGQISIVIGLIIGVLAALFLAGTIGRRSTVGTLVLGALVVVIAVANLANLEDIIKKEADVPGLSGTGAGTQAGAGLLVLLVGSSVVVVASIMTLWATRARARGR